MDDARIRQLTEDVLCQIRGAGAPVAQDLESRVAALEAAVRELRAALAARAPAATTVQVFAHPSLQVLSLESKGEGCVLEPGKPCTSSGMCRSFGH